MMRECTVEDILGLGKLTVATDMVPFSVEFDGPVGLLEAGREEWIDVVGKKVYLYEEIHEAVVVLRHDCWQFDFCRLISFLTAAEGNLAPYLLWNRWFFHMNEEEGNRDEQSCV